MRHTLAAQLAFAFLTATSSADVLVVDAAGGGDFVDLPAAIAAASEGDTLLVRSGSYSGFDVVARSLDVVADEGATVFVGGQVTIRGLAAHQAVFVSGLRVRDGGFGFPVDALSLTNCVGPVRLVDSVFEAADGTLEWEDGGRGGVVQNCLAVAFLGCTLKGGRPGFGFCSHSQGGAGLVIQGSRVELFEVVCEGGTLRNQPLPIGGSGGPAGVVSGVSFVRVRGGGFHGGVGGDGDVGFTNCACGNGGAGLVVHSPASVELRATSTTGGSAGATSPLGSCSSGLASQGVIQQSNEPARGIELQRVARFGGPLSGTIRGVAGDIVVLVISTHAAQTDLPGYGGSLHAAAPYYARGLAAGTVGANGTLAFQAGVVGFPLGIEAEHLIVQTLHFSSLGTRRIGDPDIVQLLASGL